MRLQSRLPILRKLLLNFQQWTGPQPPANAQRLLGRGLCNWSGAQRISWSMSPKRTRLGQCLGTLRNSVHLGMDQYLLIPFLVGWTSMYQLWCSPGVLLVLTHCHLLAQPSHLHLHWQWAFQAPPPGVFGAAGSDPSWATAPTCSGPRDGGSAPPTKFEPPRKDHPGNLSMAYVREYPHKIWPYMVQYLHFRILEFPIWVIWNELWNDDVRHIRLRHVGICLMFSTDFLILMFQCWILSTPGWIEIEIELRIGLKWFGGLSWESWPPLNCGSCSWTFLQMLCHRWMSFWKDMMFVPYQVWCGPLGPSHSLEICTYPGHILTYSDIFWLHHQALVIPGHPYISWQNLPVANLQHLDVGVWGLSIQGLLDGKRFTRPQTMARYSCDGPHLPDGDPMITNRRSNYTNYI